MKGVNGMNDTEKKIRQAFEHATPDVLDAVLSRCETQKGAVKPMKMTKKKSRLLTVASAAAIVVLLFGIGLLGAKLLAPSVDPTPSDSGQLHTPTEDTTTFPTASTDDIPAIMSEDMARVFAMNYAKAEFPAEEHDSLKIIDFYRVTGTSYEITVESATHLFTCRISGTDGALENYLYTVKTEPAVGLVMIDREKAIDIALTYCKFTQDQVADLEVELTDNNNFWIVEFYCQKKEHHYIIDAYTGEIMNVDHQGNGLGNQVLEQSKLVNTKLEQLVLEHAGIVGADVTIQIETDTDGDIPHYDVTFIYNGYEYEYEISSTFSILKADRERVDSDDVIYEGYNELFGNYSSFYNRAVGHTYDSPAKLKLKYFFGTGFNDESQKPTDAEWALLKDQPGFDINMDLFRLPVDKMNAELTRYFGITLSDLGGESFEGLTYLESTKCYYFMTTGVIGAAEGFEAFHAETLDDGTLMVYYTLRYPSDKEFEVGLRKVNDGYQILFNRERTHIDTPTWDPVQGMATSEQAIDAALSAAGLLKIQVKELEWELDSDSGGIYYEISFISGNTEYEYDFDAYTLAELRCEICIYD